MGMGHKNSVKTHKFVNLCDFTDLLEMIIIFQDECFEALKHFETEFHKKLLLYLYQVTTAYMRQLNLPALI